MLLVIDIGNTQIAAGIYQGKILSAHWRLSSNSQRTEDETWIFMQAIAATQGFDLLKVSGVAISSVVPDMTVHFEKMATKYLHQKPVIISHELNLDLNIRYQSPEHVGADRICNAIGGIAKYGAPLIVVDFGTATTFDVISDQREYLGGIIAPGIETSASLLHQRAARLPRVALRFPDSPIGYSTETSIQSGLMYGTVEMIDGMVERIQRELKQKVKTVATGGLARVIVHELRRIHVIDEHLTLDGLRMIFEHVTTA